MSRKYLWMLSPWEHLVDACIPPLLFSQCAGILKLTEQQQQQHGEGGDGNAMVTRVTTLHQQVRGAMRQNLLTFLPTTASRQQ